MSNSCKIGAMFYCIFSGKCAEASEMTQRLFRLRQIGRYILTHPGYHVNGPTKLWIYIYIAPWK